MKAEHFERQLQRAEQERDAWEKKYEVRCLLPVALGIVVILLTKLHSNLPGV